MPIQILKDLDIQGKRVLIREDLNVPLKNGKITSDARIRAALPTLQYAVSQGARVIVMSHLGRPLEGVAIVDQPEATLAPVAERIEELSGLSVLLADNYVDGSELPKAEIVLLENIRINLGEKENDKILAKKLADLADIYVMDAFGVAHRAQASTEGVSRFAPVACAGPLLASELKARGTALADPEQPMIAIVGGSKVSSKLKVLSALVNKGFIEHQPRERRVQVRGQYRMNLITINPYEWKMLRGVSYLPPQKNLQLEILKPRN